MCIVEFGFLKYDYGMKTHLKLFQDTKNKFTVHFYAPVTLTISLEKWVFLRFFAYFGPKSLLKNGPKVKNAPLREVFRELYIVEFWSPEHDYGMKKHLSSFGNSKNSFTMHFDAFLILIFSLEKWAFLGFSPFLGPKSPKIKNLEFSSA